MLTGLDSAGREHAVIIELKQWSSVDSTDIDDTVVTFLGGRLREVPHPSIQVGNYRQYLSDMNSAFHTDLQPVELGACSWLHNLEPKSREFLKSPVFAHALAAAPLFAGTDADAFRNYLNARLDGGRGVPVLERITNGPYAPSKKLLEHTAGAIAGDPTYTLLDDQIVAFNSIMTLARKGLRTKSDRAVVVVKGGPGTGKSVLALNVMGQLLKEGRNVQLATGSKAYTENLRQRLGPRARPLLQYFNSYGAADPGVVDVLVCDESHRIRSTSNSLYTPKAKRSERPQIDELLAASRLSVFFIDNHQAVRPGEVGSSTMIREASIRHSASYRETELHTQFRCAGSETYIAWLDQLLEIRKTGQQYLGNNSGFDFQIGCVYTAQGFEFDYVGVISGQDLRFDRDSGSWVGQPSCSRDHVVKTRSGARFTDNVKNTYRVLLTRGMQRCYVYFIDDETRDFVESRLSLAAARP